MKALKMANSLLEHPLLGPTQGVFVSERFTQFRAIPYGSIKQRFARSEVLNDVPRRKNLAHPLPKEPYDATRQGPQSIQPLKSAHMDAKSNQLPDDVAEQEDDENCLRLTITSPENVTPSSKLPVVVFLHGGAFFIGSGQRNDLTVDAWLADITQISYFGDITSNHLFSNLLACETVGVDLQLLCLSDEVILMF